MKVSILGSTGSVGKTTLNVLKAQNINYEIQALTAHQNVELLAQQAVEYNAKLAVIADKRLHDALKDALKDTNIKTSAGKDALLEAASLPADWIMAAIVGMAGIEPLLKAIEQGTHVAIANKEPLVAAGELVLNSAQEAGAKVIPVDSEHNAIFQVFEKDNKEATERIILTASGGPFLNMSLEEMQGVTTDQALAHPNWSMGQKISIDSATMMNKALEIIEAHYLFDMPADKIDVLVHPQSVIHSMVEYQDGSVLAQMGASDMSTPITNALGYPKRLTSPGQKLDFKQMKRLDFEDVDHERFPTIQLAYDCLKKGPAACIALNAANEVAVNAFLNHKIAFLDIYKIIQEQLNNLKTSSINDLSSILAYDKDVREETESYILSNNLKITKVM